MSNKKKKRMVTVTYRTPHNDRGKYFPKEQEHAIYSIESSATLQSICRKAFRRWIQMKIIKRQPRSISGGFEGIEVEVS